jgi:hypothetical protein
MGWLRIERVTWPERALWVALIVGSITPFALRPGAEDVVRAYLAAVDRGDTDAALALMSHDFVLGPPLGGYVRGPEAVRNALEYRAALNERWRVVDWEHDAPQGQVNAVFLVTNDAWELVGLRPILGVAYLVRDDRLLLERVYSGGHEARRQLRPFLLWASAERPRELAAVWREGRPVRDPEVAAGLLQLLRAWKADSEPLADGVESSQG